MQLLIIWAFLTTIFYSTPPSKVLF